MLALKVTHECYYQVQGQMALTGAKWCDFIIYTRKCVSVQTIRFDEPFWKAKVRLLSSFFLIFFPRSLNSKNVSGDKLLMLALIIMMLTFLLPAAIH